MTFFADETIALSSIELEDVTEPEELEALRPEWSELLDRCPSATPFQSPEWLLAWWKHFGSGRLQVAVLRREGRLAGIAPLFIDTSSRRLAFIGSGISDHLDVLIEPGMRKIGSNLFLERLFDRRSPWDTCDLQDIPEDSPLLQLAGRGAHGKHQNLHGLRIKRSFATPCPVIHLPATVEELLSGCSAAHRRSLRRALNLLSRERDARIEKATEESLPRLVEALFRLHSSRWRQKGLPGVLADDAIRAFHGDATRGLLYSGRLRLYSLALDGRIVAILYAFSHAQRTYGYINGFDPAYGRFSPGSALLTHAIGDAIREGVVQFDFLRGTENYKYLWGAENRAKYNLQLSRDSRARRAVSCVHGAE